MARKLRVEYGGAIYHVINRGDRREAVFYGDDDRRRFLGTLEEACGKTGWQIHAYCLMGNHFHVVLETPQPNLVAGMKWLLGTYTNRFNHRHRLTGHLFGGRYKALVVDGSASGYLRTVCDYVHLNPVRSKVLRPDEPLRAFPWSSLTDYLKRPGDRPAWLRVDRLLGELGIPKDSAAGRREFEAHLESRRRQETEPEEWNVIRRGWYCGDAAFREELLAKMHGQWREHHFGDERRESLDQHADRLVREGLDQAGWTEQDLAIKPKGDPIKLRLAMRLRQETTATIKWITARLRMGSWKSTSRRLHERRRLEETGQCGNARN